MGLALALAAIIGFNLRPGEEALPLDEFANVAAAITEGRRLRGGSSCDQDYWCPSGCDKGCDKGCDGNFCNDDQRISTCEYGFDSSTGVDYRKWEAKRSKGCDNDCDYTIHLKNSCDSAPYTMSCDNDVSSVGHAGVFGESCDAWPLTQGCDGDSNGITAEGHVDITSGFHLAAALKPATAASYSCDVPAGMKRTRREGRNRPPPPPPDLLLLFARHRTPHPGHA